MNDVSETAIEPYEILRFGNPILKQKAVAVDPAQPDLLAAAMAIGERMQFTLEQSWDGIGLAANQVGVLHRIIVVDKCRKKFDGTPIRDSIIMINPEIISRSDKTQLYNEGCLSIPGHKAVMERHSMVVVKWIDGNGEHQRSFAALAAACVQHEIDHLDGILITDK